ncbi:hypothetical protein ASZ90_000218 [hydrocarbon metagenome]|uniref:DAC domain-containing protein n=1 Tax=hydrocarbon metagenome TaxID=938273 RepID=A0A0W8G9S0_9ZZZZ
MNLIQWWNNLHFTWRELLDIAIVTFIFYRAILLVKGTRAVSIMHGFLLIIIIYYVSGEFGLNTLHWLLTNFLGSIFLVVIILFQADIRRALSTMGTGLFWKRVRRSETAEHLVHEVVLAVFRMARARTGALIVFERDILLGDVVQRGVDISASITKELLLTIFYPGTPLHDGAVVVSRDRVSAAGCILPLAAVAGLDSDFGTRHRAALGITEESDALAVVVSEERGVVSWAENGEITSCVDEAALKDKLWDVWGRRI